MSIPNNFSAPNIPRVEDEYTAQAQERFRNILRLYFALLDNQNKVINEQVSSTQTLVWLDL